MTERERLVEELKLREALARKLKHTKIREYYPDKGILRRDLYPKHMQFFEAGKSYRERLFLAANRVGKTEGAGGFEVVCHLTGIYPKWWIGRKYDRPVNIWVAGNSSKTTRDIIQAKLFGPKEAMGTGLLPLDSIIGRPTSKAGVPDAFDTASIKHVSGGISSLQFKSFDQGRTAFEGTEKDVIWLDEEVPMDIYTECLLRTSDTTGTGKSNGMLILTFTPLMGMSPTVMTFLPNGEIAERAEGSKFVVMASWDDVPHLTEETKAELLLSIPPYQRDARSKGIPQLGAGAIYPVPESDILVDDIPIPDHWPRGYSMDVGWNRTSVGFWALDRDNDVLYRYGEHYRGQAEPAVHAQAILARGEWMRGVIDPASHGRGQADGRQLIEIYKDLGLKLDEADNSVEAGIHKTWEMMSAGKIKVFKSCQNWVAEFRLYRRDESGRIVKANDHAMDETRYMAMSGKAVMKTKPNVQKKAEIVYLSGGGGDGNWMG